MDSIPTDSIPALPTTRGGMIPFRPFGGGNAMRILLLGLLLAAGALAQRHKVNINTETPEGQAQQAIAAQMPKDEDEDEWKKRVDFAKQVNTYSEYSLYAMALQTPDPRKKIALIEDLQQRNPQSQYLGQVQLVQFQAYRQAGDN